MIPNMQKNWRDLIKPRALEVEASSSTKDYAKFVARPLERGYGTTLGNSLRRVPQWQLCAFMVFSMNSLLFQM